MRARHVVTVAVALIALSAPGVGRPDEASPAVNVRDVVDKIDRLYRSEASYADVEMEIVTPHWQRTLAMKVWTKSMDKTLVRIISPKKEAGVATLRVDNEMWNYLPKTGKVIKVPPSMMMSSWMGSDFTNDDLVKESSYLDDYTYRLVPKPDGEEELIYVELQPKEDSPTVWASIILAVQRSDYLPVRQEFYDDRGDLMRVLSFSDVRDMGGRTIPRVMEMEPQTEQGHSTVVRYATVEFAADVPDEIFSLRNLRAHD